MPITKSAKKSLRNSQAKAKRNLVQRTNLKNALKNATSKNLSQTYSIIDKAAKRNLIHKKKAAHIKSRLAKQVGSDKTIVKKSVTKKKSSKKVSRKNNKV